MYLLITYVSLIVERICYKNVNDLSLVIKGKKTVMRFVEDVNIAVDKITDR